MINSVVQQYLLPFYFIESSVFNDGLFGSLILYFVPHKTGNNFSSIYFSVAKSQPFIGRISTNYKRFGNCNEQVDVFRLKKIK